MRHLLLPLCLAIAFSVAPVMSFPGMAPVATAHAQGKDMKADKAKAEKAKKKTKKKAAKHS